ncbi:FtsX-like permease family protein [Bacteroides mediterraneensis]|uniref:ABC transporter permease n=1 Tax=Bacteroides mediterraneensis TaxID=1841856 RepID=A0ABS2EU28_9BACE|nr:FtsX-like permease family protein [Bacteroides mediterraneensis]MBM6757879.1 ABC transporter permease [Bacteroides mediterraneensis]MBM6781139.1 ABC transporter permease [Bacteroides mediterraneensis]
MKTILRNLFYTLKRFRTASVLNLLGLSAAFAAFVLLMMKVSYERNFDTCYPHADRLVMLNLSEAKGSNHVSILPRGPIDYLIQQVPGIEYGTIYSPAWSKQAFYTDPKNPQYFYEEPWAVYPDFGKIIGLKFVEGSDQEMNQPESVIISESYARKLFPKGNALGSYLYADTPDWRSPEATKFRICGIFEDLPENCQFKNDLFVPMGKLQENDWGSQNFYAFFLLKPGVSVEEVNQQITATGVDARLFTGEPGTQKLYVFPIQKLYYDMYSPYYFKTGSRNTMTLLVSIGFLIILIACINLINFSTALAPMRMRSINTQKVLGSTNGELRRALTLESVVIVLVSWLLSLCIVAALIHLNVLSFMGFTPSLLVYWKYVVYTGLIALLTGIVAGLYPAWYMTSFPPALVLKGNYALSGKGQRLRTILIGFQYIVSFALITTAAFIFLQNRFMRNHDLGIDKDQILVASLPQQPFHSSPYRKFDSQLKSFAEIDDIAYAKWELGASEGYTQYAFTYKGTQYGHQYIDVTPNFCRVMGMHILSGSDFLPSDSIYTSQLNFIATQDLQQESGIPAGETLDFFPWGMKALLKGYVNNVQFTSLKMNPVPYVFCPNGAYSNQVLPFAYIRVKAGSDMDTALKHIRETISDCFTGYPTEVKFYDQIYGQLYQKETDQQKIITWFSLLAILISLVGVFGLIIFEAEHRQKEIGVRKVYGASIRQILWMFGRSYLILSVVCSLIASPIAWYAVSEWLKQFNERIAISPWVFLGTCLLISAITLVTITIQNYRTATSNPVDCLKSE